MFYVVKFIFGQSWFRKRLASIISVKCGHDWLYKYIHCVSKKRHPFYFCDIFVKFHRILLIFGRNMPQEI